MNILYISDLAGMGGGEVSLLHIMTEMNDKHNVALLCRVTGKLVDYAEERGIKTYCIDFKSNLFKALKVFNEIIEDNKIDVVHSNEITTGILFGVYLRILSKNNICNVMTCHGQWYKLSKTKKHLLKGNIKHVFCVSQSVERNLNNQGIINTSVSYLGVPIIQQSFDYNKVIDIKKALNIDISFPVIVTIARFQKIKGQLRGVETIECLHRLIPDICYLLIGGCIYGSAEDEEYKHVVEQFIKNNGMETYTKLLGERNDVSDLLTIADYVLIPSDNESFGMVGIEAIAAGKVIVSTPCDGIKEILNDDSKMISKTHDCNELSDILYKHITDSDYRRESISVINSLQNKFTVTAVCEKYLTQYKKCMEKEK